MRPNAARDLFSRTRSWWLRPATADHLAASRAIFRRTLARPGANDSLQVVEMNVACHAGWALARLRSACKQDWVVRGMASKQGPIKAGEKQMGMDVGSTGSNDGEKGLRPHGDGDDSQDGGYGSRGSRTLGLDSDTRAESKIVGQGQQEEPHAVSGGQHIVVNDSRRRTRRAIGAFLRHKLTPVVENSINYINDKSGWTEVNRLKNEISELEQRLAKAQGDYRGLRAQHSSTQEEYHRIQTEINTLSGSKSTWSDDQFRYFQNMLASDRIISNKLAVLETKMREGEQQVDIGLRELMEGLRRRFHEEQLWTDRIRMLSMWSTIAILTANSLIFLITFMMRSRESAYIRAVVQEIKEELKRSRSIEGPGHDAAADARGRLGSGTEKHFTVSPEVFQPTPPPAPQTMVLGHPSDGKPQANATAAAAAAAATATATATATAAGLVEEGSATQMLHEQQERGKMGEKERRAAAAWYASVALLLGVCMGRLSSSD